MQAASKATLWLVLGSWVLEAAGDQSWGREDAKKMGSGVGRVLWVCFASVFQFRCAAYLGLTTYLFAAAPPHTISQASASSHNNMQYRYYKMLPL